jgi:hypothetical protein
MPGVIRGRRCRRSWEQQHQPWDGKSDVNNGNNVIVNNVIVNNVIVNIMIVNSVIVQLATKWQLRNPRKQSFRKTLRECPENIRAR